MKVALTVLMQMCKSVACQNNTSYFLLLMAAFWAQNRMHTCIGVTHGAVDKYSLTPQGLIWACNYQLLWRVQNIGLMLSKSIFLIKIFYFYYINPIFFLHKAKPSWVYLSSNWLLTTPSRGRKICSLCVPSWWAGKRLNRCFHVSS